MITISICVISYVNLQRYWLVGDIQRIAFYFITFIIFSLNIVKDFLDMCWIKIVISDHIYRFDVQNYVIDEGMVRRIKEEIFEVRSLQLENVIEVDTRDRELFALFDDRYKKEKRYNIQPSSD